MAALPPPRLPAAPARLFESAAAREQYERWGAHLEALARAASPPDAVVSRETLADILSERNVVICAVKPPEAAEEDAILDAPSRCPAALRCGADERWTQTTKARAAVDEVPQHDTTKHRRKRRGGQRRPRASKVHSA